MRTLSLLALGAALAVTPAVAAPAKKAAAPAAPAASAGQQPPAEVQHAMLYLKVLISGLQSDQVEQPVKGALVGCLYNNSLGKITDSMDKVIAENPSKISRDNPSELLSAMAAICGFRPSGEASSAPTAPSSTAPKAPATTGR
jgi:hypothetical protein